MCLLCSAWVCVRCAILARRLVRSVNHFVQAVQIYVSWCTPTRSSRAVPACFDTQSRRSTRPPPPDLAVAVKEGLGGPDYTQQEVRGGRGHTLQVLPTSIHSIKAGGAHDNTFAHTLSHLQVLLDPQGSGPLTR